MVNSQIIIGGLMNILVTGAKGFIGTYLVRRLKKEGHCVFEHEHSKGDLVNKETMNQYADVAMDVVYHMAAKTYVTESWEKPSLYISNNNSMLINVLEYCREKKAKMVFMSTYLYGEPEYLPIDEEHKCVANTPYHLCKKIGEDICEFYSRNFGMDIIAIRPFNVYGKGQNREFLLPKVYEQVISQKIEKIEVFNLTPKRDYVYVEDLVEALYRIIPCINGYKIYNVGAGKSYSVKEVIDIIQQELGTEKKIVEKFSERKNEVMDCVADIRCLEDKIGKLSITSLPEGIHRWHLEDEK